jgi:hypothetical protein
LSNAYRVARGEWENALWLNFIFDEKKEILEQSDELLGRPLRSSYFRYQSREFAKQLSRGKRLSFPSDRGALYEATVNDETALPAVKSLLRLFGERKIEGTITLRDIFRVYMELRKLAEREMRTDAELSELVEKSIMFSRSLVLELDHLGLSKERTSEILNILTYESAKKDNIWLSPLCSYGDKIILVLSALAMSNVIRFLELTTIRYGLPFGEIGSDFERLVKRQIKELAEGHKYPKSVRVLPIRTFRRGSQFEEIDLALCIGSVLFAIEIKYDHFPTEPFELYHFIRGVYADCRQANRKAKFLIDNLESFQKDRLIPSFIKTVRGIVLNSTMLLSGSSLDGVPIIDLDILDDYLTNSSESSAMLGAAVYVGKNREVFYKSENDFQQSAEAYFSEPPQMRPFEEMVSKVKFSRRGGPLERARSYDFAVYDLAGQETS